ncbi:MAG: class I SAM-dependent methyltransferase [Dehalococcoidia bacterium]|nr:class I SAM-dependent methyltransferase [Dehalococcoidia bacterium]MDD5493733.1 class I SAM-dependent methyltransferase [Dehalococcoidia bacterium]
MSESDHTGIKEKEILHSHKTDVELVREVWDEFALKYGMDCRASTPDKYLVELEVRTLLGHISPGEKILDVGCGNGFTAINLAEKRHVDVTGIDISQKMLSIARQMCEVRKKHIKSKIRFELANILDESFKEILTDESFDVVLTKRVLINLLTWEEQKETIDRIRKLLKPGGRYILMEATEQGHDNINRLRDKMKLGRTAIRWHNNYLDENILLPFLKGIFDEVKMIDFSSTYYIGSRLIQPVILKLINKEPSYDFFMNKIFSYFPSMGNYGIQKLIICKSQDGT